MPTLPHIDVPAIFGRSQHAFSYLNQPSGATSSRNGVIADNHNPSQKAMQSCMLHNPGDIMRNIKKRQSFRAAAITGTALLTLASGLTAPAYAAPVIPGINRFFTIRPDHARGFMCLDVAHASQAHGADIIQARCTPRNRNQHWSIVSLGANRFEVRPRHTESTTCMDVAHFSRAHLANVLQAGSCTRRSNQAWTFRGSTEMFRGQRVPAIGRLVEIRPSHVSNMCLDVAHLSIAHGADVIQARCWTGPNQQWRFVRVPSGT